MNFYEDSTLEADLSGVKTKVVQTTKYPIDGAVDTLLAGAGVGGGSQVVAVLVLTELFGVRLETATFFALLIWIITFVVIVPVGFTVALREGLSWRGLRQISRGELK